VLRAVPRRLVADCAAHSESHSQHLQLTNN
jgi:hypothetical protein